MSALLERIQSIPVHMQIFTSSPRGQDFEKWPVATGCEKLTGHLCVPDFDGQRKAERIFQTILLVFAAIGLVIGYTFQQFSYTVYTLGAGFVLSCLISLPPWPMYRRKPLNWQKPREESQESSKLKKKK